MKNNIVFGRREFSSKGYQVTTPSSIYANTIPGSYITIEQQKIDSGLIKAGPSLVAVGDVVRQYDPLSKDSLYKIFSELPYDEKNILGFANLYGMIGVSMLAKIETKLVHVEPISRWQEQILLLKIAVSLWEHIQSKDEPWLRDIIFWEDTGDGFKVMFKSDAIEDALGYDFEEKFKGSIIENPPIKTSFLASKEFRPEVFKRFEIGEVEKPAKLLLQMLINNGTKDRVTSQLLFDSDWTTQNIYLTANSLLGFMWLQLAMAIEGNLEYRRCVVCNNPFQVDPSERGKPRRFCSNACRAKEYRRKKLEKEAEK